MQLLIENTPKTFSPYLLLLALKEKLSGEEKIALANLDETIQNNIWQIIKKCNARYSDAGYRGHDALNRAILLDPDIATYLTPETLIAIFKSQEKDIKLNRNTYFKPTIAGALEYGFKPGLDVIKTTPNNPPVKTLFGTDLDTLGAAQQGVANYEKQLLAFEENTLRIVETIKSAAEISGLDHKDDQFQILKKSESPTVLFARINKVIQMIKAQNESNILLANAAGSSIEALRDECSSCVKKLSILTKVDQDITDITLSEFVQKCFADPNYMLNDRITHSFYDRLHLATCIEEDDEEYVLISEKIYSISQLIEEMVKQSENPEVSHIIKQQFTTRLQMVMDHLLDIKNNGQLKMDYPDYNDILLGNVEIQEVKKHENLELLEDWRVEMLQYKEQGNFDQLREEIKKLREGSDYNQLTGVKINLVDKCLAYEKVEIQPVQETPKEIPPEQPKGIFDYFNSFFTNYSSGANSDLEDLNVKEKKGTNNKNTP